MRCFSLAVRTHIFQHLDLGAHAIQLLVILAFQLAQHCIAVLTARIGRCAPVTALTRRGVGCARIGRKGGARISGAREAVAGARSWSTRGARVRRWRGFALLVGREELGTGVALVEIRAKPAGFTATVSPGASGVAQRADAP